MEKRTMGALMSALRKSKGMTQQNVADRLGVSNKAVSKWECDDGYPDIAILPAIAEIYGVTVDELLKGEIKNEEKEEKNYSYERGVKQVESMLANAYLRFRNLSIIAVVLSVLSPFSTILFYLLLSYIITRSTASALFAVSATLMYAAAGIIIEYYAANKFLFSLSSQDAHKCEDKLYKYYTSARNHIVSVTFFSLLGICESISFFLCTLYGFTHLIAFLASIIIALFISLIAYLFINNKFSAQLKNEKAMKIIKKTAKDIVIGVLCISVGMSAAIGVAFKMAYTYTYVFEDEEMFENFEAFFGNEKNILVSTNYDTLTVTYADGLLFFDNNVTMTMPLSDDNDEPISKSQVEREDGLVIEFCVNEEVFESREEMESYLKNNCISGEFLKVVPAEILRHHNRITYMNKEDMTVKANGGQFSDIAPLAVIAVLIVCIIFAFIYAIIRIKKSESSLSSS